MDLTAGFSKGFGSKFLLDGRFFGFGLDRFFNGYLDIYINQLLVQSYEAAAVCAMAVLLYFEAMVITGTIVKAPASNWENTLHMTVVFTMAGVGHIRAIFELFSYKHDKALLYRAFCMRNGFY
ncbi:MAG TPA: hypothetical protein VFR58_05910 [Flavisolibacter sp.]|nr:hypothetical protein [Flavisolibacter sp.]